MSKTVMRVMVIGLVAMLGAKAEAHYYVVAGKAKYCSVCVDAELAEHEEHAVNPATLTEVPAPHREGVEFCVKTKQIDVSCPGSKVKRVWKRGLLPVAQKPIAPGATTVQGIVSDESLKDPLKHPDFCQGEIPDAVLIRAMTLEIRTYACAISDPTNSDPTNCETVSKWEANCRLPEEYGFSNVAPLEPFGAPYNCSWRN